MKKIILSSLLTLIFTLSSADSAQSLNFKSDKTVFKPNVSSQHSCVSITQINKDDYEEKNISDECFFTNFDKKIIWFGDNKHNLDNYTNTHVCVKHNPKICVPEYSSVIPSLFGVILLIFKRRRQ